MHYSIINNSVLSYLGDGVVVEDGLPVYQRQFYVEVWSPLPFVKSVG